MTDKMTGGLIPTTELIDVAANDGGPGGKPKTPLDAQARGAHGWDPLEVWRTRVKAPRERSAASPVINLKS
jgi:hypothetical protein